MKNVILTRMAIVLVSVVWASAVYGIVIIDEFTNATPAGTALTVVTSGSQTVLENPGISPSGPMGGWRSFTGVYGAPPNNSLLMYVEPVGGGGYLNWTNVNSTGNFFVEYGIGAGGIPFQLNADLTGGVGYSRMEIDWLSSNTFSVPEWITVSSHVGEASFVSYTLSTATPALAGSTQQENFSSFPGIDWTDVDYIKLEISANLNQNRQLGSIAAIPEPSSLALLGLCAVAAGALRRRRQS